MGNIEEIDSSQTDQSVLVDGDWYHPKQLRRLKRKPKPVENVAREFWIYETPLTSKTLNNLLPLVGVMEEYGPVQSSWANSKNLEVTHVREVLEGSVQVTRESLAKAYCNGREYISLDELCKAVGLEEKRK